MQGIERETCVNVLEDADANDDGFLSFEDWLISYTRERPVWLTLAVLLAHCGCCYVVLNILPIETMFKAVGCVLLLAMPQLVTAPVIKAYNIAKSLYDRLRATIMIAQQDPEDDRAAPGGKGGVSFGA